MSVQQSHDWSDVTPDLHCQYSNYICPLTYKKQLSKAHSLLTLIPHKLQINEKHCIKMKNSRRREPKPLSFYITVEFISQ